MRAYTRNLTDTVTYWPPAVEDAFGQAGFARAELVDARWEDKAELVRSADGEEFTSSAQVIAAKALSRRGWLALGDHSTASDPRNVDGAQEIKQTSRVGNLRGDLELHTVWL